jgi:hypothetical protein
MPDSPTWNGNQSWAQSAYHSLAFAETKMDCRSIRRSNYYWKGLTQSRLFMNAAGVNVRPSQFTAQQPLRTDDLQNWSQAPSEVMLEVNSRHSAFRMATSCRVDWFVGAKTGPASLRVA